MASSGLFAFFKKLLIAFVCFMFVVTVIIVARTFTYTVSSIEKPACSPIDSDYIKADDEAIRRFQQALRYKTVSTETGDARRLPELQNELKRLLNHIITGNCYRFYQCLL